MTARTRAWPESLLVLVVGFVVLGVLAGWLWSMLAEPPHYTLYRGHYAYYSSELQFTKAFGMDLTYAWIGAIGGVLGGLLAGWRYGGIGWPVVLLAGIASALAAFIAWRLGILLGPEPVHDAVASAQHGDSFATPLALGARSMLLSWPLATLLGVMVSVWLSHEPQPTPGWSVDPS